MCNDNYNYQKILLVGGSDVDRALVQACLIKGQSNNYYQFVEAESISEGLQYCDEDKELFDCIIVDVVNAEDCLLLQKELMADHKQVLLYPLVVLASISLEKCAHKMLQAGAQDYIVKEVMTVSTLSRSIDNAIHRHKFLQQLSEQSLDNMTSKRTDSPLKEQCEGISLSSMSTVIGLVDMLLDSELDNVQRTIISLIKHHGQKLADANSPNPSISGKRVLFVDNTRSMQLMAAKYIRQAGGTLFIVEDEQKLMHLISSEANNFDLIIIDLKIPEDNGLQIIKYLQSHYSHLPVLLLCDNPAQLKVQLPESLLSTEYTAYVEKPIHRHHFLHTVKNLLTNNSFLKQTTS